MGVDWCWWGKRWLRITGPRMTCMPPVCSLSRRVRFVASRIVFTIRACHAASCVIGCFSLALTGPASQSIRRAADAAPASVQDTGRFRSCSSDSRRQRLLDSLGPWWRNQAIRTCFRPTLVRHTDCIRATDVRNSTYSQISPLGCNFVVYR